MLQLNLPILLSAVALPFVASVLLPIVGRRLNSKTIAAISSLLLLYPLIIIVAFTFAPGLGEGVIDPIYFQQSYIGSFSMLLDGLSGPIAFSIALVTCMVAVFSLPYMTHRFEEMKAEGAKEPSWGSYYMLYIMFSSAMLGTTLSTNLLEFYIFLELTLVPSFLLIAFYGYGARERIALMYLIWTHVGALLYLIGTITIGFNTGTFDIVTFDSVTMSWRFNVGLGQSLGSLALYVAIVLMIGLFIKMAVFGVHIWLPYAHAESPTPVSALLSPNLIGIGGYALVRIVYLMFPTVFSSLSVYLIVLALVTMIYGGLMSLAQDDFKRMLAYSSISQMGYLLLGIGSLNNLGISGAMLHYATHAVGKAVLFSVAGVLIVQLHGLRSLSKMGGLASKMPITASLAIIGFMNITGVPPSLGLWSEVLIVFGAVSKAQQLGVAAFVLLVIALLVAIGLSTAYSFITMRRIFFGHSSTEVHENRVEARIGILLPIIVVAAVGVILFFYPAIFIDPLIKFIGSLNIPG